MKTIIIVGLVVGFCLFSVTSHPICLDVSFPQDVNLQFCSMFNGEGSCCSVEKDAALQADFEAKFNLSAVPENCTIFLKQIHCASCDPYSGHLFGGDEGIGNQRTSPLLCLDYCQRFYNTCLPYVPGFLGDTYAGYCKKNAGISGGQYCYPYAPDEPALGTNDLDVAFPNLGFPQMVDIQVGLPPSNYVYIVDRGGFIYSFINDPTTSQSNIFLDISGRVTNDGEMGLLGLAFHPDFQTNKFFYVNYVRRFPTEIRSFVARYSAFNDSHADPNSEFILLSYFQPFVNHNGGCLFFGLDGYLYIPTGDGGSGGDPFNNAQNTSSPLGKMLRINVDQTSPGKNYSVPSGNMFENSTDGSLGEIWAMGLRNPWRCALDKVTNRIICGDVGQNEWEEISLVKAGANYGWRMVEGDSCFNPQRDCNVSSFEKPLTVYPHNRQPYFPFRGGCVIGGRVYRGKKFPELFGAYLFNEFGGDIYYLPANGTEFGPMARLLKGPMPALASWAEDHDGELLFVQFESNRFFRSKIYKLKAAEKKSTSPSTTSETRDPVKNNDTPISGLNGGEIAGIAIGAVGCAVLVVLIGVMIKFYVTRKINAKAYVFELKETN